MADAEDLKLLQTGNKSLTHCDFRKANLANMDFSNYDFSGSLLVGANISGCNFTNANLTGAKLSGANASNAVFMGARLARNLINANLSHADLRGAHPARLMLSGTNLYGADIRGVDLSRSSIGENANFSDVLYDENTRFDGSSILRATARTECFRYYDFVDGVLVRKKDNVLNINSETRTPVSEPPSPVLIAHKRDIVRLELAVILQLLSKELDGLNSQKPNELGKIRDWEKQVKFLEDAHSRINTAMATLSSAENIPEQQAQDEKCSSLLQQIGASLEEWLSNNKSELVDWCVRLSFVGLFIGLLNLLGAHMPIATAAVIATVCPHSVQAIGNLIRGKKE